MTVDEDIRRKKARAAWAFSGMKQEAFADAAGISYDRWRGMTGATLRGPGPSLDELHRMADAAGMPRAFMSDEFGREAPDVGLRLATLERQVGLLLKRIEVGAPPAPPGVDRRPSPARGSSDASRAPRTRPAQGSR